MNRSQSTRVLADTNVVSEFIRRAPDPRVIDFTRRWARRLVLPVVALHELEYGVARMPPGRRRARVARYVAGIARSYRDRVLDLDPVRAREAARIRTQAELAGRTIPVADALIAGTARAEGIPLATRNLRDFEGLGIELIDPWKAPRGR